MSYKNNMNPNPEYHPPMPARCEDRVITMRAGMIAIHTDEYWILLRAKRDLEILKNAYICTKYGTIDSVACESVFGPKPKPEPEPEPAPDPSVLLAKVTDMTEKAQRLLEEIESRQVKSDA